MVQIDLIEDWTKLLRSWLYSKQLENYRAELIKGKALIRYYLLDLYDLIFQKVFKCFQDKLRS